MKCPYCDNEVPMNVTNCPSCGAQVPQQAQQYQQPMMGQMPQMNPMAATAKSRTVYVLLAIFLGALGVHNFYAGYTGRGIAQLLITLLTMGWAAEISWIWAIIEAITVKNDAKGIPFI